MGKKIKSLRVSLLLSILCTITSGINYLTTKLPIVGIMFIVITIALIIQVVAYTTEMKNIKKS
ncbi:hypothetical protein BK131_14045 [Paenibacillus amylolyticus]|uniref:Uncharacterized protein n=1 Tax=Paenibacillus amylolyticus TaxID=1451 RepID=A0A1R1BV95_PAEAM|nr:hypothetical protein [Paenibacillus amylolyticus]OMF13783.1 hypothetical protein BK131_14045 [Paenibacillus amylolyticus]